MALQTAIVLSTSTYNAGATPPPQATIICYNPLAVPVVVTAAQIFATINGTSQSLAMQQVAVPTGPGINVTVPALGSLNLGPFGVVIDSAANANQSQMVNQVGNLNPVNPQLTQPPSFTVQIQALVFGSDGSVSTATPAAMLVSSTSQATGNLQGGALFMSLPTNAGNYFWL